MSELEKYRKRIDGVDNKIIDALIERMIISKYIGTFKKQNNIPIIDEKRFDELLQEKIKTIASFGYDENFITEIYNTIHKYSIKIQQEL